MMPVFAILAENQVTMVVNGAEREMDRSGGGTNLVIVFQAEFRASSNIAIILQYYMTVP